MLKKLENNGTEEIGLVTPIPWIAWPSGMEFYACFSPFQRYAIHVDIKYDHVVNSAGFCL